MKTISNELKIEIEDAISGGVINLPPEVIEKDVHVTDVLSVLSRTSVKTEFSLKNPLKGDSRPAQVKVGSTLVFAGGTCLSKAHGLISRMSEDVDIKVVLNDVPEGYHRKSGGSSKARLTKLQDTIFNAVMELGFDVSKVKDENPLIRDAHRYYHLSLDYVSVFPNQNSVLRPQIKLELIHRPTLLACESKTVGYLFDKLLKRQSSVAVNLDCISVPETLAEKVLSMLRRCAWNWYGGQEANIDSTLVRHIYDVGQIIKEMPDSLDSAKEIFPGLVLKDGEEFGRQYLDFTKTPRAIMLKSLAQLGQDEEQIKNYGDKLKPLIYSTDVASFEEAYKVFKDVAEALIDTLPADQPSV